MSKQSGWDRVYLPLALSLGAHAALVTVCLWAPVCTGPRGCGQVPAGAPSGPFSLQFVQVLTGPREPLPSEGQWLPVQAEVTPPVPAPPEQGRGPGPAVVPDQPRQAGRGGGAGNGARGPGLLAVGGQARRVVYLIDCSVSMGPTGAFARARAEVLASTRQLQPGTAFQVIAYSRTASPLVGRAHELLSATPAELDRVAEALQDCSPSGQTDHVQALRAGLAYNPDVLYLLTDADDLRPAAARELAWLRTGVTAVHVVELSGAAGPEGQGPLAQLAARTGGTHRRARPD